MRRFPWLLCARRERQAAAAPPSTIEAERLRGLEIDDQLELGCQLNLP
jgi:hypothetical protein